MKQHITIEQLNELDDEAKEKLRKWFNPEYDDTQVLMYLPDQDGRVIGGDWDQELQVFDMNTLKVILIQKLKNYEGIMYPLLSIGQMIEFIDEKWDCWGMQYDDSTITWWVYSGQSLDMAMDYGLAVFDNYDDELCDALWEAIKFFII